MGKEAVQSVCIGQLVQETSTVIQGWGSLWTNVCYPHGRTLIFVRGQVTS